MQVIDDSGFKKAKQILLNEASSMAMLVGNGVNLAGGPKRSISWEDLLAELIDVAVNCSNDNNVKSSLKRLILRDNNDRTPASLPEAFDIIQATYGKVVKAPPKDSFQAIVADLLNKMVPDEPHRAIIRWAFESNIPILTTNYDHCLQNALPLKCKRNRFGTQKPMSQYYPWDRYYAPKTIIDPLRDFAIWHIHGDCEIRQSIRAGLDQYMGMVQRLRAIKSSVAIESLQGPKEDMAGAVPAFHKAPWLRIFMGRKLWIQGLALQADEVSIRWLLIERYRYWSRYLPDKCTASGWYIHGPTDVTGSLDKNRKTFLESVGIRVIEIIKKDEVYSKLFSGMSFSEQYINRNNRCLGGHDGVR